jgi:vacuolar-type H+-ATPase subunit E/Vma4
LSVLEIRTEIERKAEEETSRIIANAKQEAEKITVESNAKLEALRNEKTKTLTRALDTEQKAELAVSRMEQKGQLLRQKSEWANRVFEEARKRLVDISEKGGAEYREFLSKLILEGITRIEGNRFIVEANSRDAETIKKGLSTILERAAKIKNEKIDLQVKSSPTILLGGVIVSNAAMTQYYNNTLDARVSQAEQKLSGDVYKIIFKTGD